MAQLGKSNATERATMNGSLTVLGHERRRKELQTVTLPFIVAWTVPSQVEEEVRCELEVDRVYEWKGQDGHVHFHHHCLAIFVSVRKRKMILLFE